MTFPAAALPPARTQPVRRDRGLGRRTTALATAVALLLTLLATAGPAAATATAAAATGADRKSVV